MPTARELLEQADALMRRNRGDSGIPVLTDSVPELAPGARGEADLRERVAKSRAPSIEARLPREPAPREDYPRVPEPARAAGSSGGAPRAVPPPVEPPPRRQEALAKTERPQTEPEPPLLTDAVADVAQAIGELPLPPAEIDPSLWLGPDTIDPALHSITGPAPDTVAVVPPVTLRAPEPRVEPAPPAEDRDPTVTRTLRAAGSAPMPPPAGSMPPSPPAAAPAERASATDATGDDERWLALSEQISMQVLQRLDLFVDTGLKAQLAAHLQPIVARASAELVATINDHVGQLVRTYVAEAIEREIAQWRQQNK